MRMKIEFNMDNAAFDDPREIGRILGAITKNYTNFLEWHGPGEDRARDWGMIRTAPVWNQVRDLNGNHVGFWFVDNESNPECLENPFKVGEDAA